LPGGKKNFQTDKLTKMLNRSQQTAPTETTPDTQPDSRTFGRKIGLITRLIGCYHKQLSRPFVERGTAYKSCLSCGARKPFDPVTFESDGNFYYPPVNQL
jgi:hypothetical protein